MTAAQGTRRGHTGGTTGNQIYPILHSQAEVPHLANSRIICPFSGRSTSTAAPTSHGLHRVLISFLLYLPDINIHGRGMSSRARHCNLRVLQPRQPAPATQYYRSKLEGPGTSSGHVFRARSGLLRVKLLRT